MMSQRTIAVTSLPLMTVIICIIFVDGDSYKWVYKFFVKPVPLYEHDTNRHIYISNASKILLISTRQTDFTYQLQLATLFSPNA